MYKNIYILSFIYLMFQKTPTQLICFKVTQGVVIFSVVTVSKCGINFTVDISQILVYQISDMSIKINVHTAEIKICQPYKLALDIKLMKFGSKQNQRCPTKEGACQLRQQGNQFYVGEKTVTHTYRPILDRTKNSICCTPKEENSLNYKKLRFTDSPLFHPIDLSNEHILKKIVLVAQIFLGHITNIQRYFG